MFGDVVARPAAARLVGISGFIVEMPPAWRACRCF
jgi:hypothetical protein